MFNIVSDIPGSFYPIDTIRGISNLYTKDMKFLLNSTTPPYVNYFIHPEQGATPWFKTNTHDSSNVIIANSSENYKTIGSMFQFGSLTDIDIISTKEKYLLNILDFFETKKYIYTGVDDNYLNSNSILKLIAYPNPAHNNISLLLITLSVLHPKCV